jgi:hypothetical protein
LYGLGKLYSYSRKSVRKCVKKGGKERGNGISENFIRTEKTKECGFKGDKFGGD